MNRDFSSRNLDLRPCSEEDIDLLLEHWTKPLVRRFLFDDRITDRATVKGLVQASITNFNELRYGLWVLTDKMNGRFVGVCGFSEKESVPDLHFSIEPECWGKGLATESANCVISYAFNILGVIQISASVDKPNLSSIRVLEKTGMIFKEEKLLQGNPLLFYGLTKQEFQKRSTGVIAS